MRRLHLPLQMPVICDERTEAKVKQNVSFQMLARFEVLTVMRCMVLWIVTTCSYVVG